MKPPENLFDIAENIKQRFIHATDDSGKEYLISLPKEKAEFHSDILSFAEGYYNTKLQQHGGGKIRKNKNIFYLSGKSNVFGDFDKGKVAELLKRAYPQSEVLFEQ